MSTEHIQESVKAAVAFYNAHPDKGLSEDKPATARLEDGLHCRAAGPHGTEIVTDMPAGLGGGGLAPSSGWYLRAALASCVATTIALRAAELGINLGSLEVTAGSRSDDRGMLQIDDSIQPGFLDMQLQVAIESDHASEDQLRELVGWAERHSPLIDSLTRPVPLKVSLRVA